MPTIEAEQGRQWVAQLIHRLAGERGLTVSEFDWSFDFDRRVHWLRAKFDNNQEMSWSFSDENLQDSVADKNVQRDLEKTLAQYFIPDAPQPPPSTAQGQKRRSFDDPYPTKLDDVLSEIDYWVTRQGEGEPGSTHETRVQQRLDHLRGLEQRYSRPLERRAPAEMATRPSNERDAFARPEAKAGSPSDRTPGNSDDNTAVISDTTKERPEQPPTKDEPSRETITEIAARALADKPSKVDLLDFEDYADALADFIKNEKTEKPITIGIAGSWGTGKTTLMRMVEERLADPDSKKRRAGSIRTVWFNAWRYEQQEALWAALVLEILRQVKPQLTWTKRVSLWIRLNRARFDWGKFAWTILRRVTYVIVMGALGAAILGIALLFLKTTGSFVSVILKYLAGVGMVSITVAAYTCVKDFYDRVVAPFDLKLSSYVQTPDYRKQIGFLGEFEVDFRRVIKAITTPSEPLVIFVDDLDRCSPTGTAGVIEAINVLLDADNCVYVIGMDSRAIASSLEVKYAQRQASGTESDDPGGLSLGDRFLEKIIQIQFNIPVAHTETLQKFAVANLNLSKDLQSDKKAKRQIIEAEQLIEAARKRGGGLDEAAATVRDARPDLALSAVDQAKKAVYSRSLDDSEEARTAIRSVLPYLGSNPRKIVRFINLFRLQAIIANRRKLLEMRVVDFGLLAKWLIIATRWTGVMETLVSDSAFKSKLETARNTQNTFREHEETGTNLETLRTAVNLYLEDPRVKKWINSTDLVNLLKTMSNEEIKTAPIYLHLTQITATIPPSV